MFVAWNFFLRGAGYCQARGDLEGTESKFQNLRNRRREYRHCRSSFKKLNSKGATKVACTVG